MEKTLLNKIVLWVLFIIFVFGKNLPSCLQFAFTCTQSLDVFFFQSLSLFLNFQNLKLFETLFFLWFLFSYPNKLFAQECFQPFFQYLLETLAKVGLWNYFRHLETPLRISNIYLSTINIFIFLPFPKLETFKTLFSWFSFSYPNKFFAQECSQPLFQYLLETLAKVSIKNYFWILEVSLILLDIYLSNIDIFIYTTMFKKHIFSNIK